MSATDAALRVTAMDSRLRRIALVAKLTDTVITVPGTDVKLGLDAVIGAVPVAGDLAMGAVALVLVHDARQLGVPRRDLARMLRNVVLDTTLGSIPFIGDLFDLAFRSNERNLRIIEAHVGRLDAPLIDTTGTRHAT